MQSSDSSSSFIRLLVDHTKAQHYFVFEIFIVLRLFALMIPTISKSLLIQDKICLLVYNQSRQFCENIHIIDELDENENGYYHYYYSKTNSIVRTLGHQAITVNNNQHDHRLSSSSSSSSSDIKDLILADSAQFGSYM